MDLGTILGLIAFAALIFGGIVTNQITASLVNMHGFLVVFGGTFVAMFINTPFQYLVKSILEIKPLMLDDEAAHMHRAVSMLVTLAEQCRMKGFSALKDADRTVAYGFLARVADAALEYND